METSKKVKVAVFTIVEASILIWGTVGLMLTINYINNL